ncbi:MAG TPA: efflux RND transporter periplasmic adaptor subunit [Usitatibacter sp.]|jgi:membrane fusion protein (multidrug efflux system)|nr:efflux RND transporter periplasmic adaptor subunit [Usitatibacter sp.]
MTFVPSAPRRAAFLVLASSLFLAACGHKEGSQGAGGAAAAPPPLPVTVVEVHTRKVPISLEAVGQAEGSRDVEIRGRVNGIIEKRLYEEGAPVKAGQILFQIDPAPYELAVEEAKAALQQERVKKELAEVDAKRLEPLAREKAISERELDQALATAKQATASIASAEAKLKEAQLDLAYTKVSAPISGITGRALRSEGSLVTANTDSSLLTTLTQVNPIWVRFPLAEADFKRVRGAERETNVQLIDDAGKIVADHGRLNFTSSTVDPKLGAVQLRAEFPNPQMKWLPGQFAKVRILAGQQEAMLVPQGAVLQSEQSRLVMTVGPDNKVVPKPVQTANWVGTDMVVTGGLAEGDRVIVDNLMKLRPGATVEPHPPGEKAPAAAAPPPANAPAKAAK